MPLETLILGTVIAILARHWLSLLSLAGLALNISVQAISPASVLVDLRKMPWSRRRNSWRHLALTLITLHAETLLAI